MAEYQPVVQEIQVADCDLENFSHPSHSIITSPGEPKPKSTDKHLPNGITRISPDNNGIINHGPDGVAAKTSNNYSNCQNIECLCDHARGPLDPSQQQENLCDSRKSSNQHIIELTSDLDSLNIDKPSIEEKDILLGIEYVVYQSELQMPDIMRLITKDLSEPYSIYTYRYFIHNWPKLCFLAMDEEKCVGAIVCKLDMHKKMVRRGYIAMLAVDSEYRRKKIGSHLVLKAIKAMIADDCDEVVLETEITNQAALRLYENLGFVRDKRLFRYYLNGVDALRLKLWLR